MKLSENDAKLIWVQTKDFLPIHQQMITETIFNSAKSYRVCWICGDDKDLNLVTFISANNIKLKGILCKDCLKIQQSMGLRVIKVEQID